MYIELTTRCNMRCPHCCMNATSKGTDMTLEVFKRAWRFNNEHLGSEHVCLGGGEPTLCRDFKKIFDFIRGEMNQHSERRTVTAVLLITNGSRIRNCRQLFKEFEWQQKQQNMYREDRMWLDLNMSDPYDGYHDMDKVNWEIYQWFSDHPYPGNRYGGVQDRFRGARSVYSQGRAKNLTHAKEGCVCPGVIVKTSGDLKACGCTDSPVIGSIYRGLDQRWERYSWLCYKEALEEMAQEEEEKNDAEADNIRPAGEAAERCENKRSA